MPAALVAAVAGLASGLALVAGAAIGWWLRVPRRVVAIVMAFGAGVLISALAFDLLDPAVEQGGIGAALFGFLTGAVVYVGADLLLERRGARHKTGRGGAKGSGTGVGIALGALLDGVPETAVQGVQIAGDGALPVAVLAAVIISNVPEGLSSTADMKESGRGAGYIFGLWGGIALASALSALAGFALLGLTPPGVQAFVTALAGGAILAMIADTMIPEAFQRMHALTGLVAVLGFGLSYTLHALGG